MIIFLVFIVDCEILRISSCCMLFSLNFSLHKFCNLDIYFSNPNSFAFSKILLSTVRRGNHGTRFFFNITLALCSINQEGNIKDEIASEILFIFILVARTESISVMTATLNKTFELPDDFKASLQN